MTASGAASLHPQATPRWSRLAGSIDDLLRLAAASVAAILAGLGFLFWRTSWGAVDATSADTALATALLLTPAPTWTAWMLTAALDDRATPGQRRRGLRVRFAHTDRAALVLARFAAHPLSVPAWLWLAAIAYLLALPLVSVLFAVVSAVVALAGLGSAILVLLGRPALHDHLLGTEVSSNGKDLR